MLIEFLLDYGDFLLKTVTIVVALIVVIAFAAFAGRKQAGDTLEVEDINDNYRSRAQKLREAVLSKDQLKADRKERKSREKKRQKEEGRRPRSFVIDFKGDLKATAVESLREEISAVLAVAGDADEVIMRLENHGGVVHEHGLAASQLARIRDRDIRLTICVRQSGCQRRLPHGLRGKPDRCRTICHPWFDRCTCADSQFSSHARQPWCRLRADHGWKVQAHGHDVRAKH